MSQLSFSYSLLLQADHFGFDTFDLQHTWRHKRQGAQLYWGYTLLLRRRHFSRCPMLPVWSTFSRVQTSHMEQSGNHEEKQEKAAREVDCEGLLQ